MKVMVINDLSLLGQESPGVCSGSNGLVLAAGGRPQTTITSHFIAFLHNRISSSLWRHHLRQTGQFNKWPFDTLPRATFSTNEKQDKPIVTCSEFSGALIFWVGLFSDELILEIYSRLFNALTRRPCAVFYLISSTYCRFSAGIELRRHGWVTC